MRPALPFQYLLAGLAITIALLGCSKGGETWSRLQASGVMRVGLDPTFPPFEVAEGGDVQGIDVDLAKAIAAELGLRAEFVHLGYDGLYDALGTKQVDVLISALVIFPERTRDFAYSEGYFNAGEILVVSEAEDEIEVMRDLAGRRVAVELGALGHVEADRWARSLPGMEVIPYDGADEAMAAVESGVADAAVVDAVSGRLYVAEHPKLRRSQQPVTVEPYAMVVRNEDRVLLEELDGALASLKQRGQLEGIIGRWLGE